jgi:hypothetical protein
MIQVIQICEIYREIYQSIKLNKIEKLDCILQSIIKHNAYKQLRNILHQLQITANDFKQLQTNTIRINYKQLQTIKNNRTITRNREQGIKDEELEKVSFNNITRDSYDKVTDRSKQI